MQESGYNYNDPTPTIQNVMTTIGDVTEKTALSPKQIEEVRSRSSALIARPIVVNRKPNRVIKKWKKSMLDAEVKRISNN